MVCGIEDECSYSYCQLDQPEVRIATWISNAGQWYHTYVDWKYAIVVVDQEKNYSRSRIAPNPHDKMDWIAPYLDGVGSACYIKEFLTLASTIGVLLGP